MTQSTQAPVTPSMTQSPKAPQTRGTMPTWFRSEYLDQIVKPRLQYLIRTSKAPTKEALRQEFNGIHKTDVSVNLFNDWLKECGFNLVTKLVLEGPLTAPSKAPTLQVAPGQDDDSDLNHAEPMAFSERGVFNPSLGGIIDNGD